MDKIINVLLDALIVIAFIFGVLVGSGIALIVLTLGGFING